MYVTGSGNPLTVTALDAKTGRQIWRYTRQQPVKNPYENNRFNRGVAILGNRLFVGTLDAVLIALDARSGAVLWQVQMADTMEGYELTSPPLVVKDKVIMGMGGGEYATRGFIDAYDAASGKRLWRFYTVPGPGEFGNETWKGDSWQKGGGGAWLTPTYDPELNLGLRPGRQSRAADRSIGQRRRARQPVQLVGRRARCQHRPPQVALPVHAERRPRLGFHRGHGPRRSHVARPAAQAAAARRSQRLLLRARSRHRRVPPGHAVRLSELEQGLRRERPSDRRAGIRTRAPKARSSSTRRSSAAPTISRRHTARSPGSSISSTRNRDSRYVSASG